MLLSLSKVYVCMHVIATMEAVTDSENSEDSSFGSPGIPPLHQVMKLQKQKVPDSVEWANQTPSRKYVP